MECRPKYDSYCGFSDFVPQPPQRRPMTTVQAAANESDEDRQFRKVFQQLAGDVCTPCFCLESVYRSEHISYHIKFICIHQPAWAWQLHVCTCPQVTQKSWPLIFIHVKARLGICKNSDSLLTLTCSTNNVWVFYV